MKDFVCYCRETSLQFLQDETPNVLHVRDSKSWKFILLVCCCLWQERWKCAL